MPLARYVRCTRYALRGKKDLYHIESQSDISNLHQQIYRAAFAAYRQNRKFPYLMAGRETPSRPLCTLKGPFAELDRSLSFVAIGYQLLCHPERSVAESKDPFSVRRRRHVVT